MDIQKTASDRPKAGRARRLLGPYQVLLGNRDLDLIFAGQTVSALGDWLYIVALTILAYSITHSPVVVALLTFVRLLPDAFLLPIAGTLADRWNRKAIMIGADFGRSACLFGLLLVQSPATLPLAFPLVFLITSLTSLFRPALNSALPAMVSEDDLVRANSLMSQMDGLSLILGPTLAGVLVLLGRTQVAFIVDGVTFLLSGATLCFVRLPQRPASPSAEEEGWLVELRDGFRFLFRENEGVLAACTVTLAALSMLGGASWTLIVVFAEKTFHLGSQGTGSLIVAYGVGGLLAGFVAGPVVGRLHLERLFIASAALSCGATAVFGLSPAGPLPFVCLGVLGLGHVLAQVTGLTIIQLATPNALLGRTFGALQAAMVVAMLLAALAVGPLVGTFGPRTATIILVLTGITLLLLCLGRLRAMERVLGVRLFLRAVPILATLSRSMLDELASQMRIEQYPAGATIIREGEHGDRFYIIKSGRAEVVTRGDREQEVVLASLTKLDYFGEIALLRNTPRTATVRACEPVELVSLQRADFEELLQRSHAVRASMSATSDARYVNTQNKLLMLR